MRKIMTVVAVVFGMAVFFAPQARAEFSAADKDFLWLKCQIFKDDLAVIPSLSKEVQAQISAWVATKDAGKFESFRNTRNYYKFMIKIKPGEEMPFSRVPTGWDEAYLLPDEISGYNKILAQEHKPCKEVWLEAPKDQLSSEQKAILLKDVQVPQEDIDTIKFFSQKAQKNIAGWITAKDLRKLVPFKDTRDYYRKLLVKPGKFPTPPATWDYDYLTPEEFINFCNMQDNYIWS